MKQTNQKKKHTQIQVAVSQVTQRQNLKLKLYFLSVGVLYQSLNHFAFKVHLILAALSNANETEMYGNYGESTQCY